MNRRGFFSLTAAGAVSMAAGAEPTPAAPDKAPNAQPLRARLGHQMGEVNDTNLSYLARYGVEGICASATIDDPSQIYATASEMKRLREAVEKHGMTLDLTDSVLLRSTLVDQEKHPSIMLAQSPQRDRDIESFQNHIRACAEAGVPAVKYNMSILGVVRSGTTPGRGDALYATWRLKDAPRDQPLTRAGMVNADAAWERITYFLERVVPE